MGRGFDEKSEFELQHPPEARGPWANEVSEARNRAVYCQFKCKEAGRKQMAHRVLPDGRRGICNWCYRGEPHPDELNKPAKKPAPLAVAAQPQPASAVGAPKENKEEVMAKELCSRGCGKKPHRGNCKKSLGGGKRKPPLRGSDVLSPDKPNGDFDTEPVSVPVGALDRWFIQLPPEKKAFVFHLGVGR